MFVTPDLSGDANHIVKTYTPPTMDFIQLSTLIGRVALLRIHGCVRTRYGLDLLGISLNSISIGEATGSDERLSEFDLGHCGRASFRGTMGRSPREILIRSIEFN